MLGTTLTVTINAVAKVLPLINQDGYSAEYYLKEALQEFRVKVRHSKEKSLVMGAAVDRHNVEITQIIYPSVTYPLGVQRQVYTVIRNNPMDDATSIDYLSDGIADWVKTNTPAIVAWNS